LPAGHIVNRHREGRFPEQNAPGDTLVSWFRSKVPNWKEADPAKDWRGRPAMPGGE
jgi:hypothetical protein